MVVRKVKAAQQQGCAVAMRAAAVLGLLLSLCPPADASSGHSPRFDVNGDGRPDLVVTAPGRAVEDSIGAVQQQAGTAYVLLATRKGISSQTIVLEQATGAQADAHFGAAYVSADFNKDGYADLAISAPDAVAFPSHSGDGIVDVFYGSANGDLVRPVELNGLYNGTEPSSGEHFGESLAAADFNHDGFADLAVGSPEASINGHRGAGKVLVFNGGSAGVYNGRQVGSGMQEWDEDSAGIRDDAEGPVTENDDPHERFGAALAAGDVNGDGNADLIVGVPGEYTNAMPDPLATSSAGAIQVILGSRGQGLKSSGSEMWDLSSPGVGGAAATYEDPETGERFSQHFGAAVVTGDFNRDGITDVAVGIPDMQIGTHEDLQFHGAVSTFNGSASGLAPSRYFDLSTHGVPGKPSSARHFGTAFAAGDFNRDGYDDLAIGAPGNNLDNRPTAGSVVVLDGGPKGIAAAGHVLTQDTPGVPGRAQVGDEFGWSLRADHLIGSRADDLIIGVPGEDVRSSPDCGFIDLVPGTARGLTGTSSVGLSEVGTGIRHSCAPGDGLGRGGPNNRRISSEGSTV